MTGKYKVDILTKNNINYKFELKRKYSILTGNSGIGKSYVGRLLDYKDVVQVKSRVSIQYLDPKLDLHKCEYTLKTKVVEL